MPNKKKIVLTEKPRMKINQDQKFNEKVRKYRNQTGLRFGQLLVNALTKDLHNPDTFQTDLFYLADKTLKDLIEGFIKSNKLTKERTNNGRRQQTDGDLGTGFGTDIIATTDRGLLIARRFQFGPHGTLTVPADFPDRASWSETPLGFLAWKVKVQNWAIEHDLQLSDNFIRVVERSMIYAS